MSPNGALDYKSHFEKLAKGQEEIRDSLIEAVRAQTSATLNESDSIKGLKSSVDLLAKEISQARKSAENSVPIKMVALMFLILLVSIAGIEALKLMPKWLGLL